MIIGEGIVKLILATRPDTASKINYQTSTNLSGSRQLNWPIDGCDFTACFLR